MSARGRCPQCNTLLNVPQAGEGAILTCPVCHKSIRIAGPASAPGAAPPATASTPDSHGMPPEPRGAYFVRTLRTVIGTLGAVCKWLGARAAIILAILGLTLGTLLYLSLVPHWQVAKMTFGGLQKKAVKAELEALNRDLKDITTPELLQSFMANKLLWEAHKQVGRDARLTFGDAVYLKPPSEVMGKEPIRMVLVNAEPTGVWEPIGRRACWDSPTMYYYGTITTGQELPLVAVRTARIDAARTVAECLVVFAVGAFCILAVGILHRQPARLVDMPEPEDGRAVH